MKFAKAPAQYSEQHQDQVQREILTEDKKNLKIGSVLDELKFRDTVTGAIVTLTIASGVPVIS